MIRPTRSSPAGDDKPTTVGGPVEPASVEKSGAIDEPSPPANDVKSDSTREYTKSVCPTIGGIMALASVLSFVIASVALLDCLDDLKGIGRPLVAVQVELRVPRIWTQLMLRSLGDQGSIEVSRFASLSAKLVGCGYTFTQSDDAILCECGRMATWKFRQMAASACHRNFGNYKRSFGAGVGHGCQNDRKGIPRARCTGR